MMKCCCLIVIIFCTTDVSNGGTLSGICLASKGTCGKKGVPCKETFGSEWTVNGKCCNKRPCCKCQVCPKKFDLLPTQANGTHCYYYGDSRIQWDAAQSSCASTPGAYLWRPNTVQEANDVRDGLIFGSTVWTGATYRVKDGNYKFSIENGTSFVNFVPYGEESFSLNAEAVYVEIFYNNGYNWINRGPSHLNNYVCKCKRRVCP